MNSGQFKWENCKYRSDKMTIMEIGRCACEGGNYMASGYECNSRNLFQILPEICEFCWAFENKSGISPIID